MHCFRALVVEAHGRQYRSSSGSPGERDPNCARIDIERYKAERRGRPKGSLAGAFGHKRTVGKLRDVLATWQYLRLAIRRGPSEAYQSANSMHFSIYPCACLRDLLISNVINFANSPACSASSGNVAPCVEPLSWTIKRGVEASRVVERYVLMARTVAGFIVVTLIGLGFSALRHVEVS